jgi:hypothetical protein
MRKASGKNFNSSEDRRRDEARLDINQMFMSGALARIGWLEVEADLCCQGSRGYVVRAAEGGEEVVERVFVGDVDTG